MTVPAEPILIGGRSVYLKFFAMPRNIGDPRRIEGTMTLVGSEGVLTLDALVGPQGEPGEPSPIIRPEWGSPITNVANLPALSTLGSADDGRAWYINGQWHVYNHAGEEYVTVQGSIPGPPGVTPDISVTAELIEADSPVVYGSIDVIESGPSNSPNFHIKIPGVPGPAGPSAAIETAADYDDSVEAETGDFLVRQSNGQWGPAAPTFYAPRKYTIPHNQFIDHTGSEARFLIASLSIPAQEFDWVPDVVGHVRLARSGLISTAQCEVEVRIGPTSTAGTGETSPLCGLAPHDPSALLVDAISIAHISPHFSSPGDPNRSLSPIAQAGRCTQGVGYTVFVFVHKVGGNGSWEFVNTDAQLRIDVCPVD